MRPMCPLLSIEGRNLLGSYQDSRTDIAALLVLSSSLDTWNGDGPTRNCAAFAPAGELPHRVANVRFHERANDSMRKQLAIEKIQHVYMQVWIKKKHTHTHTPFRSRNVEWFGEVDLRSYRSVCPR